MSKARRWSPRPGSRVKVIPKPRAASDEPPPPSGIWFVIDRGPRGQSCWWVQPCDLAAKAWASAHSNDIINGCWLAPDNQLRPLHGDRI